jgi:hypothetical protein
VMHILVFLGFVVVAAQSVTAIAKGFDASFLLPGFDVRLAGETTVGQLYALVKDLVEVLVLVAVGVFWYRRLVTRPERLTFGKEAHLILGSIAVLMLTDFLADGGELAASGKLAGARPSGTPPTGST